MVFCTHCGKEPKKGDVFCRSCGSKIREAPSQGSEIDDVIKELNGLVNKVAEEIKRELLSQVAEVEKGFKTGLFTKDEFDAEVEEIKGRLLRFTQE